MYRWIIWVLFFVGIKVQSRTISVGNQNTIQTINEGISLAQPGDTVFVFQGIYKEGNIAITKSITLIGIDYPVLDGQNKVENITISGHHIKITGFRIIDSRHSSSNDYAAVNIIDASDITIENNIIENAHFGIHISNSTYCNIGCNTIKGKAVSEQTSGNGIHLWKSNNATINDNFITGHRDGIYLEFVTKSIIVNNISEYNIRYGLHFMFSHEDQYVYNKFNNNGTGVAVMYSHKVTMKKNIFENNKGASSYGILLKDISDGSMLNNLFSENTIGIYMEGTSRMEINKNSFENNGWAMKVQANCAENNINFNNFQGNTFDIGTNGTMVLSNFNHNFWDKYEGYDLKKNGIGDIPYHPVSLYSMIIDQNPTALLYLRSFIVQILDKAEKAIPSLTPENLIDASPYMNPVKL